MSKKKNTTNGLVYSTDPGFKYEVEEKKEHETLPAAKQKLRIRLDTKQRAGKAVTLVQDFIGSNSDLEELGKKIKTFCGTGGSVKNGEIIIQGDQREKVLSWLQKNGFISVKKI
ncbi:MAG TPA: translation initiation factor [Chitinophagaceae bacterium]